MTWEIALVPALLCLLAGILVATTWLEQQFLAAHQVVLLLVAEQAQPERPLGIAGVGAMASWADDTSRSPG